MKKTRIIIPALAMIAFSVAASITGTVAWFTANRTANIDAGTYAVVKTTSDLTKNLYDGIGTSTSGDIVTVNGKLSDASFDHTDSNKYIYEPNQGQTIGKKVALASATDDDNATTGLVRGSIPDDPNTAGVDESATVYTAITWKVTFSLDFGAVQTNNIGLFLDLANSTFTASGSDPASSARDTSKGFRMAFIPTSDNGAVAANGEVRVFADLQTAANCTYVTNGTVGSAIPAGTAYAAPALIDSSDNTAIGSTYTQTQANSMPNYLGKFVFASSTVVKLSYTVVCWFEGTDENIVNGTTDHVLTFRDVQVDLAFSAITFSAN